MRPPGIACRDLECGYHGKTVLQSIEVCFGLGESTALLGMNGSGKSTLLKTLSGELRPMRGTIEIFSPDGVARDLAKLSPIESARLVSTVPQEELNPFAFTALEIVAMGRLARSNSLFDSPEDLFAAKAAMDRVECGHLTDRVITELSGGEKQRVLIARSLAQETAILLMDEPTSHLDPPHQLTIATLISSLAKEGRCMVTAVHDLNLASILATRAVLIGDGKVVADGPVEAVLESTALEECYRSSFERVRTKTGRLIVVPKAAWV